MSKHSSRDKCAIGLDYGTNSVRALIARVADGGAVASSVWNAGGHANYDDALNTMTGLKSQVFNPNPKRHAVYKELYSIYRILHDAFGTEHWQGNLHGVMKQLIQIRTRARS